MAKHERSRQDGLRWELLFQAVGHPTLILDSEHTIVRANDAAADVTGMPREELTGKKCYEVFHRSRRPPEGCPLEGMKHSDRMETAAMEMEAFGRTYLVSCTPVFDDSGDLDAVIHIATDITERKKAEKRLRESRRFLQDVFDGIQDGISVLDTDLTIVRVNEWITKRHHDALPLDGKKCYRMYQQRDSPCPACPSVKALSTGAVHTAEVQVPASDGAFWSEVSAYPLRDENGEVTGVIEHVKDITQRKEAVEKLYESEEKYRSLFHETPLGAFHYDTDGVITDCNETFVEIIGSSKEALIGLDMLHDLDDEAVVKEVRSSLQAGSGYYEGEYTSVTGGTATSVRVLFKGMRDEDGTIYAGMGLVEDITERKKAEQKLRESERQMRTLMGNLPGMAYRCRNVPQWTMEFLSRGCRQLTGYEPADVMNDETVAYGDIVHPDDRDTVWETVQQAVDAGKPFEMEYRIITKKGEERWVWERGTCVASDEKPAILEGFISDVTARKKAERRYRSVVENAHDAIYVIHPEWGFQYVNPAFENLTGYPAGEIYSEDFSFWNLIHPDDRAMIEERGVARARGETVPDRYEFRILAKNGDVKTVEATTVDVAPDGVLIMGILRDVTQRRRAEQERERAYQEMERALELEKRFKADASHFFLNPIAICKGYLALHSEHLADGEKKKVEAAEAAIKRIEAVINNIVEKGEIRE